MALSVNLLFVTVDAAEDCHNAYASTAAMQQAVKLQQCVFYIHPSCQHQHSEKTHDTVISLLIVQDASTMSKCPVQCLVSL